MTYAILLIEFRVSARFPWLAHNAVVRNPGPASSWLRVCLTALGLIGLTLVLGIAATLNVLSFDYRGFGHSLGVATDSAVTSMACTITWNCWPRSLPPWRT